ncbi:MAG: DUF2461 domain-containing protein [Candidatus Aminicenantes bacterium]|nr:MAG: DUF2461 domain-containing protein [Candidatus Aminicenantes bacterium]
MEMFTKDFIDFFKELSQNNNKKWFDQNRKRYENSVKIPFRSFVERMIEKIHSDDPEIKITPAESIFRINRDIRFSRDKTPYKTQASALISRTGKKDKGFPGIFFSMGAKNIMIYGGAHSIEKERLYNIRKYISEHTDTFSNLLDDSVFKEKYGRIHGEKNKRIPAEFNEAAEKQPLLFNKAFYYYAKLDAKLALNPDLENIFMDYYLAAKPMRDFLISAVNKEEQ